jgi:hypothetical protein
MEDLLGSTPTGSTALYACACPVKHHAGSHREGTSCIMLAAAGDTGRSLAWKIFALCGLPLAAAATREGRWCRRPLYSVAASQQTAIAVSWLAPCGMQLAGSYESIRVYGPSPGSRQNVGCWSEVRGFFDIFTDLSPHAVPLYLPMH